MLGQFVIFAVQFLQYAMDRSVAPGIYRPYAS